MCIIDEELSMQSHHEVIVCDVVNMDEIVMGIETSQELTGWSLKPLLNKKRKEACADCPKAAAGQP